MRKLAMQMELTLDGFMTGPNGEMDWFALDPEAWKLRVEKFNTIDTVPNPTATPTDVTFSHWLDDVPKVVFSRTLKQAEWQNSRLAEGDLAEEISRVKAQPGKDVLIMNSASIAQECMRLGLLDECWLNVHPVAIGRGRPLFEDRVGLRLLESRVFESGQVFLRYATQPRKI
jgi:dihydrofolate reductase